MLPSSGHISNGPGRERARRHGGGGAGRGRLRGFPRLADSRLTKHPPSAIYSSRGEADPFGRYALWLAAAAPQGRVGIPNLNEPLRLERAGGTVRHTGPPQIQPTPKGAPPHPGSFHSKCRRAYRRLLFVSQALMQAAGSNDTRAGTATSVSWPHETPGGRRRRQETVGPARATPYPEPADRPTAAAGGGTPRLFPAVSASLPLVCARHGSCWLGSRPAGGTGWQGGRSHHRPLRCCCPPRGCPFHRQRRRRVASASIAEDGCLQLDGAAIRARAVRMAAGLADNHRAAPPLTNRRPSAVGVPLGRWPPSRRAGVPTRRSRSSRVAPLPPGIATRQRLGPASARRCLQPCPASPSAPPPHDASGPVPRRAATSWRDSTASRRSAAVFEVPILAARRRDDVCRGPVSRATSMPR